MNRSPFTKDDCIQALREAAEALGPFFTRSEYEAWAEKRGKPSSSIVARRFRGLWNEARAAAGLLPVRNTKEKFSDADILAALQKCADDLGEYFSDEDYRHWWRDHRDMPAISTIRHRFGDVPLNEIKRRHRLGTLVGVSKYVGDRWKEGIMRFIQHQLSYESYLAWCRENGGPDPTVLKGHAGGYVEALMAVLLVFIKLKKPRKKREKLQKVGIGHRFGLLTVINDVPIPLKKGKKGLLCRCDCGKEKIIDIYNLMYGLSLSCGCMRSQRASIVRIKSPITRSSTGIRGVTKAKNGKYVARISFRNKNHYLGVFDTLEEAAAARKAAEERILLENEPHPT